MIYCLICVKKIILIFLLNKYIIRFSPQIDGIRLSESGTDFLPGKFFELYKWFYFLYGESRLKGLGIWSEIKHRSSPLAPKIIWFQV